MSCIKQSLIRLDSAHSCGHNRNMIRSLAHLLLILVVLACPVQCVIGGDLCCASKSAEAEAASAQTCSSTGDCCRAASERQESNSTDEAPKHVPESDDDCNCDCLCKGAISSASRIAEDCGTTLLDSVVACRAASTDVSRYSCTPQADPPDVISGRETRTLQMSFQV